MTFQLDVPSETVSKLLHLAEQTNQTPADYLASLVSQAERTVQPLSADDVFHQWVLANISDTVFITQDDGTFTYICPNIHTVFGYTDGEVWQLANVQALGLGNIFQLEELIAVGEIANIDAHITDKAGAKHNLLVNIKRVGLGRGTVLYVCRDNTARRRIELRLTSLYEATSYLFQADSLLKLGDQIVQAVIQEFDVHECSLMMADPDLNQLTLLAHAGQVVFDNPQTIDLGTPGPFRQAVESSEPVYRPLAVATQNEANAQEGQQGSQLLIPLGTLKGVVGVLVISHNDINAFTDVDLFALTAFANRSAAVLENMQLYEEINHYAAELEWRVIQRTAELERKSEQIEAILNHSGDAIALVDEDGIIQQANHSFYRYFGYVRKEAPFDILITRFTDEQAELLTGALHGVFEDSQPRRLEILVERHDGIPFDADVLMSPVLSEEQEVISVICSIRDITERKHIEAELRRSLQHEQNLNEIRSRFVSSLSHEYRTPLAIILSSSEILRNHIDAISAEQRRTRLEIIRDQVRHMTQLMDDLVEIGRTEAITPDLKAEAVEISAFCKTVVAELQSTITTHSLEYKLLNEDGLVLLDKKLMRQVLYNLLSNAIKYSPTGTTVFFDLECDAAQIRLRVRDQGIGIPSNDLERLFEAYYRAHNVGTIQGTGLGLPIIKRAVEAHGGTISVESEINMGSTFTVTLPRGLSN